MAEATIPEGETASANVIPKTTIREVLEELEDLDPQRMAEVRDFVVFLKGRQKKQQPAAKRRHLTAQDFLDSGLAGMWADRTDIGDSAEFARKLRRRAEMRGDTRNVPL